MKLLKKKLEKDGQGMIKLLPQEEEDMWHVYNLIVPGDLITGQTFRKVQKESSTGSTQSQKMKMNITLLVEEVDFDAQASSMRIKGKNMRENQFIKMGQSHTLELALQRAFTLEKDCWDAIFLQRIDDACDIRNTADAAAIIMELGLANLVLITSQMSITRARIEVNIPRKRYQVNTSGYEQATARFYNSIIEAVRRHINFDVVKVVVVASPAYINEDFLKYMFDQAVKHEWKVITENRSKFITAHSSSGHKHVLKEVLEDPSVAAKMTETKAYLEVQTLNKFFEMLGNDPDRAFYGFGHVKHAAALNAIDTLLITDTLFRNADIATRRQYVKLTEDVADNNGTVVLFSAMHTSGERLAQMSGVAAILRFPLPDVDLDGDDDDDDSSDDDNNNRSNVVEVEYKTS